MYEQIRALTTQVVYMREAFRLLGGIAAFTHQLAKFMETDPNANQETAKWLAQTYVIAQRKANTCSDWLAIHEPELRGKMDAFNEIDAS